MVVARWGINFVTSDPAPPLGHAGAPVHLDRELNLGPGEGIVLFTDGVVERRDESLDVGLKRLAEIVATVESSSPDIIADTIVTELCADRKDDCCILVVRRDP